MKDAVIILCGGGPAPGMNSVSMSVAKTFLSKGYRVIGLHGGYSGLFSKNARTEDLDFFVADRYFAEVKTVHCLLVALSYIFVKILRFALF